MRMSTPHYVKSLARGLRKEQTEAEQLLWERLRGKRLNGFKFYRQCPIGRYIADFYCSDVKLVIEVDGGVHETERQKEYDTIRQDDIESRDITILRFTNEQVLTNLKQVIQEILTSLEYPLAYKKVDTKTALTPLPPMLWGKGPGDEG